MLVGRESLSTNRLNDSPINTPLPPDFIRTISEIHPPAVTPPAKILLVEDHPLMRYGFSTLLSRLPRFQVCGEADCSPGARELVSQFLPDLALVDITLKSANGIELTKEIRVLSPSTKVLIVSVHTENIYAERALNAGAMGYLMKDEAVETLVAAIDTILGGEVFVSESIKGRILLNHFVHRDTAMFKASIERLSDREVEVLRLVGTGYGNREIAQQLKLSVKTVDSFKQHLRIKLALETGGELIRYAIEWMKGQSA